MLGVIVSIDLLLALFDDLPTVVIHDHSLRYANILDHLSWQQPLYLLCICGSPLLSSHKMIQGIGALIVIGLLVSAYAYYATLVSVWCFFAAADSTLLYFHFKRAGSNIRSTFASRGPARPR